MLGLALWKTGRSFLASNNESDRGIRLNSKGIPARRQADLLAGSGPVGIQAWQREPMEATLVLISFLGLRLGRSVLRGSSPPSVRRRSRPRMARSMAGPGCMRRRRGDRRRDHGVRGDRATSKAGPWADSDWRHGAGSVSDVPGRWPAADRGGSHTGARAADGAVGRR